ncbi:CHAD domain-containing protein [Uliginosibacterium sp. H3]|uniref:CHAD domain-containing protein n=1 Tax=Uliginosibacterium silvisoli TaxID=3114758 RepID=A0ABU6K320_9RHOO|nr:CHAD domain-containing protein [Uliginosibacterium sp. H3]
MAREIELKLAFPPEALKSITRHPLIAATTRIGRAQTLENTYYDTPDETLGKALIAVRTRRIGNRWLQTIKSANASAGGLSSRPEWEQPFNRKTNRFDFSVVDDVATRELLEKNAESIAPLFTTTFRRETREFAPHPGLRILLMIDTGTVSSGSADSLRTAPISELELELAEGEASDLLDYALQLGADLPLMPEDVSKAQRGYQLLHNEPARAVRARNVALDAAMTPHAAFLALAFECLQAWQANALGALTHDDPEFIHQFRVSLRRLRTLLRILNPQLPSGFAELWQEQLGQLANDVGQARDLDVMHESLLHEPAQGPDAPTFETLIQHLGDASQTARLDVRNVLHSPYSRILLLQFSKALHTLATPTDAPALQDFARDSLRTLRKQVARRLERAQKTKERDDLHRVRIALKRLRYALEFFASLFSEKLAKPYQRKLGKILGELGELNDIAVGRNTLRQWAQTQENLRETSIWIAGWHAAQEQRRSRRALEGTAALLKMSEPWKRRGKNTVT